MHGRNNGIGRFSCRLFMLGALVLYLPCSESPAQEQPVLPAERPSLQALDHFNASFVGSIAANDPEVLRGLVDWQILDERISLGATGDPEVITEFLMESRPIVDKWVNARNSASAASGSFKYRRLRKTDNSIQAVYRLIDAVGRANYYGLVLRVTKTGKIRVIDFDDVGQGEMFSQYGQRALAFHLNAVVSDRSVKPTPALEKARQEIHDLQIFDRLITDRKALGALGVYRSFPENLKRDRRILFMRMQAASGLEPGGAKHREAIEDMIRFIPGGASLHLVLMNYYMHSGESEKALAAANSLLNELGPDAWIETQISVIYKGAGQLDLARATIDRACDIEPDLVTPHTTRAGIAAAQFDFSAAVESLRRSEAIRPFADLSHFENMAEMQSFVASKEYRRWKSDRTIRSTEQPKSEVRSM